MLVNPTPHLSHVLSSMHRECIYAWKCRGKENSPQGGGSGDGLIGTRNMAQSSLRGVRKNLLKVHLEGGWIGVNANLRLNANSNALKTEANASVGQTNTIQQV